jgi:hypothetical protein
MMAEKQVGYNNANKTINGIPELYFYYAIKYGDNGDAEEKQGGDYEIHPRILFDPNSRS